MFSVACVCVCLSESLVVESSFLVCKHLQNIWWNSYIKLRSRSMSQKQKACLMCLDWKTVLLFNHLKELLVLNFYPHRCHLRCLKCSETLGSMGLRLRLAGELTALPMMGRDCLVADFPQEPRPYLGLWPRFWLFGLQCGQMPQARVYRKNLVENMCWD